MQLYAGMFKQVLDALLETTIRSLTLLHERVINDDGGSYLLTADIILKVPNVVIVPSLQEVQHGLMETIRKRMQLFANLTMWGQQALSKCFDNFSVCFY